MTDTASALRIIKEFLARDPVYGEFMRIVEIHRTRPAVIVATRKYKARKRRR